LGPHSITPRVLAHEFGHILGFRDRYVRGYKDLAADGFEILEVLADPDDIMAVPGSGSVLLRHFEMLLESGPVVETTRRRRSFSDFAPSAFGGTSADSRYAARNGNPPTKPCLNIQSRPRDAATIATMTTASTPNPTMTATFGSMPSTVLPPDEPAGPVGP